MAHIPWDPHLDAVVEFTDVSMSMPRRRRRRGSGRRQRLRRIAGEARREEVDVLRKVSFRVQPGEAVAVLGSTVPGRQALLRLVAGTLRPDSGTVRRNRPIVPMVEVARSFARTYSIRQNIYIVGGLLGMTPDQVEERLPGIVETSGVTISLDRFLGAAPALVRQKLAWSIAMSVEANAYAIDRTIVVGDEPFREQCWEHVKLLLERGSTFVIATDSPRMLRNFCSRALVLSEGRLVSDTSMVEGIEVLRQTRQEAREMGDGPA